MLKLLGLILLIGLGSSGMYAWDRHPPIGWHLNLIIVHPGFSLPDSLGVQRDKALAGLHIAQDGEKRCQAAIGAQNASIASLAQESAVAMAKSRHDVEAARAVAESYRQTSVRLDAYKPVGPDVCSRWEDADRVVVGTLK